MSWTDKYFYAKFICGAIVAAVILLGMAVLFVGWLIEKIRNKFDRRLAERTERRLNNRKDDD